MQETHPETDDRRPQAVLLERARARLSGTPMALPLSDRAEGRRSRSLQLAITEYFLLLHACVLVGLAFMGRGFAYLFVAEAVLVVGGVLFLLQDGTRRIFAVPQSAMIVLLMAWGAACTVPYLAKYRIDAIRDYMLVGYAAWAVVLGGFLVARPERLPRLILRYRKFCLLFAIGLPIIGLIGAAGLKGVIRVPGGIPLIQLKTGDTLVHVASVGAFLIVGIAPAIPYSVVLYVPTALAQFAMGNRAGQLAIMASLGAATLVRGFDNAVARVGAIVVTLAMLLVIVVGTEFTIPGTDRDVSLDKLFEKLNSLVGESGNSRYDNTKEWRLNWWRDIVNYTVLGDHFWTGKGFGINLATDDNYQVSEAEDLRSPHNSHMNVLARSGVPGLALWVVLHGTWVTSMARRLLLARRRGQTSWAKLFALLLIFWAAYSINASFDVVFEGPMAAVWFWSIFGVGMAAVWIHQHTPEVLTDYRRAPAERPVRD